jgi:hypothetical protein
MKRFELATIAVAVAVSLPLFAFADPGSAPKNLQVFPKGTTKEQVKAAMKSISKELGVECDHCHDVPDMASDKLAPKKIAREMMKMTEELNSKWIKKVDAKAEVTCNTCHRGEAKPAK